MKPLRICVRFTAVVLAVFVCALTGSAQIQSQKCRGPVYEAKDVAVRAKITRQPDFNLLTRSMGAGMQLHVEVEVVLCRSGRVTDIKVTKSEPPLDSQIVADSLSVMTFKPAESNWHTVSQRQKLAFTLSERGFSADGIDAAGRLTEEIDVVGNRRLAMKQILAWITTRPGDNYNPDQLKRDLQALLKTGLFDAFNTYVTAEDAPRGGVRVIFQVHELPLIAEIAFQGVAATKNQFAIMDEFSRRRIDVRVGRPLDPVNLKKATKLIEDYFQSQGWTNVKAEALVENLKATEVKVTFKITGTNF
jgi:hypothetical protein